MDRVLWISVLFLFLTTGCGVTQSTNKDSIAIKETDQKLNPENIAKESWPLIEMADSLRTTFSYANLPDNTESNLNYLSAWYKYTNYQPIWSDAIQILAAINLLQKASDHGLNPQHYQVNMLLDLLGRIQSESNPTIKLRITLDMELSQQIRKYAQHLYLGKLKPTKYHPSWNFPKKAWEQKDTLLIHLIQKRQIPEIENRLAPSHSNYKILKNALEQLNQQKIVSFTAEPIKYHGTILQLGDSSKLVSELKQRLCFLMPDTTTKSQLTFDTVLMHAVKAFQQMHGLTPDGIAGPATYQFLNWSAERYIDALRVNLERLRWLPDSTPKKLIAINLPAFELVLIKNNTEVFRNKIIIGKPKHFTPVFQSHLNILVFNPCWTIPHSIATKKMLPKIKKDSTYLKTHNMFIAIDEVPIAMDSIDFSNLNESNFPYKIYQNSGPDNALGVVKFLFNNPYQIYLHDTPQKQLFNADSRAFSHGCIRLQNPLQLANQLLQWQDASYKTSTDYLRKKYPVKVPLINSIPIYIQYFTATTTQNGESVCYYNDVYGNDLRVLIDLERADPIKGQ